jgi:polysaccharide pyruvyl transferase CsaB
VRLLISGYYGFGNAGDEALLSVIVAQLRDRYPGAEIDVLSAKPSQTREELGVEATPRFDLRAIHFAIQRADVVLSGGGGLLQNRTSLRSLLYYAGILRAAVRAGRKTMIFAQSVGPLDFWGKTIVKECCKNITAATVRDARSAQLLRSLLPAVNVEQTADPVFLFDEPDESIDLEREGLGSQSGPYIVFSVRKAQNMRNGIDMLARAADRFACEHGARVVFLPLGGPADAEISTMVIRKCKSAPVLIPQTSLAKAAAIIARAQAVVGMRLHALVFAARYAVPFLAIPYDPKVSALCQDLAYPLPPLFTPGATAHAEAIDALVDRLWSERPALSQHLTGAAERLRVLALRNFEVLDSVVESNQP